MRRVKEQNLETLRNFIFENGEEFPKKHGSWRRAYAYDDKYLLLDTWNHEVYQHEGCTPSGTDNMYRVVYAFSGYTQVVEEYMAPFWLGHLKTKQ